MDKQGRSARVERSTRETQISLQLRVDGQGEWQGSTGVGFFDHMLELLARHAGWDLAIEARGDVHVDDHHTVEDVGIVLGQALVEVIGDGRGLARYGSCRLPMEEALAEVAVDCCGRALLVYRVPPLPAKVGAFDTELAQEFWSALARSARMTLHINVPYGTNAHHMLEATFKSVARALRVALVVSEDGGLASSKGVLY